MSASASLLTYATPVPSGEQSHLYTPAVRTRGVGVAHVDIEVSQRLDAVQEQEETPPSRQVTQRLHVPG